MSCVCSVYAVKCEECYLLFNICFFFVFDVAHMGFRRVATVCFKVFLSSEIDRR